MSGAGWTWQEIPSDQIPDGEGRVRTVVVNGRALAVSRCGGVIGALDNRCPHQGGPLGEGSIENGLLRCPWHGYDYDPITGQPPSGFSDAPEKFEVDENAGRIRVLLPPHDAQQRTVSDAIVDTLLAWGVTTVFGMVGHSNLGFADALRRAEERGDLRYVGIRHEGAAAFAASAYGKLTGRPAACLAIAGPGSTNLLTGLYDAKVDRSPVVAISGQVPSESLGRGAFQDLDLGAVFRDVAVSTTRITAASNAAELTAVTVKRAIDARGVGHLVLPDEVQGLPTDVEASPPEGRSASVGPADSDRVAAAVTTLAAAKRPVLIVGEGARHANTEVIALAELLSAPVVTTFQAKGLVPDTHPLAGGVLGRSGTPVASWLMNESDLLLVVGASFAHHTGIATYKPVIQIDHSVAAIGRFDPVQLGVVGDAAQTLRQITGALQSSPRAGTDQHGDVAARWQLWRTEKRRRASDNLGRGVPAAAVFAALSEHAPDDAVITVDVGNHAYSFGRYFESRGQPVLMSGYLGSIGFGYPAAMGAWAADPRRPVIAVTGDGGFGQYLAELTTAVKYKMAIKHVLLDNGSLGKITKEQLAEQLPAWQTSLVNPDFADYARLCGATGITVTRADELDDAMRDLFAADGPAL
ncbi:MAG: thiamine pyrophosphate-binding protein, partial [Actinomycetes bacterium]